jgi:hypothetical protein
MRKRRGILPLILNLCGMSRRADSFVPPLLYLPVHPEYKEAGWAPEPVWILRRKEKSLAPARIEPETIQTIAWSLH